MSSAAGVNKLKKQGALFRFSSFSTSLNFQLPRKLACSLEMDSKDPQIVISEVDHADLALATIQRLAFSSTLLYQRTFGQVTPGDFEADARNRLLGPIGPERKHCRVIKASRGGDLLGFALWNGPEEELEKGASTVAPVKERRAFPPGTNAVLGTQMFAAPETRERERPHWRQFSLQKGEIRGKLNGVCTFGIDLSILATDPKYQRTGAGTALLAWGCDQADLAGLSTYLKATPGNAHSTPPTS